MIDNVTKKRAGKMQLGFIALAFGVPLALATWMYNSDHWLPERGTNYGAIL